MSTKEITTWQDETALERFQLISPLLDDRMDSSQLVQKRKEIAEACGKSEKTIRRYEQAYRDAGFGGLKPQNRTKHRSQKLPDNFDELLAEAIQLKREVPRRSVHQIIFILESEGRVGVGELKRSTLQRYLYDAGFGQKQMRKFTEGQKSSSKRFCKPHRMMLLQADIKYGPQVFNKDGKKVKTYLTSIIDDHSRYILSSVFYDNQEATIVEETFRKAILLHGHFDAAYCDNGKQYISAQLKRSCAKLGIKVYHAKPFSGQSKGKIEKFHQVVDAYFAEAKAKHIKTLDELNRYWSYYVEEYYQKQPHDGIREYYESYGVAVPEEGISPEAEWNRDSRPLSFIDASTVGEAFLHYETREVDKGGCISFKGGLYEVSTSLIGAVVTVAYDPMRYDTITVTYPGIVPIAAKRTEIGAFCDKKPEIPLSMLPVEAETSRMLDVLEKKHRENRARRTDAISYSSLQKGGEL